MVMYQCSSYIIVKKNFSNENIIMTTFGVSTSQKWHMPVCYDDYNHYTTIPFLSAIDLTVIIPQQGRQQMGEEDYKRITLVAFVTDDAIQIISRVRRPLGSETPAHYKNCLG